MNYRAIKAPVAAEAFPFVMPLAAFTFTAFALDWDFIGVLCMAALVFVLAFFRNPERYHKIVKGSVLAGADGKVVAAGLVPHDGFPGGQCLRIAIFMSVFECHINWSPVNGKVLQAAHYPGKFINAMHDKCADENERKVIVLETDDGHRVEVKLVAGLIARRIVCPIDAGDTLTQGEKIGLIRFGSRVEILVPANSALHVRPGMMIRGAETVVATLPETVEGNLA
jgi:phosphatidylserine decarboxylase